MNWNPSHIASLVTAFNKGDLTTAEQEELNSWVTSSEENQQLFEELTSPDVLRKYLREMEAYTETESWEKIKEHDSFPAAPVKRLFPWRRWAVAASVIGLLLVAGYFISQQGNKTERPEEVAIKTDAKAPDKNLAMITLDDGSKVYLDSAKNGELVKQGDVKIVKNADGSIEYSSGPSTGSGSVGSRELVYNTLSNPKGSLAYTMTLSDGSKVWLNAGSSITYPVLFIGNERKVSVTGEAYFEVTRNAAKPFYVSMDELKVEVLGTHFNVNAFDDESEIKVTLLEGSVKVTATNQANSSKTIRPGQQAVFTQNNPLETRNSVNLEEVLAWKNNRFYFDNADIKTILLQLSRWYNVEVEYKEQVSVHLTGIISRNVNATDVFRMLEQTGAIHLSIEGNKIIVRK